MTITHLKAWVKNAAVNIFLSVILTLYLACLCAFIAYSIKEPVFFLIAMLHLIATGFGGVWLLGCLEVPVDFPGTVFGIFILFPSLLLFHGATYIMLGLNMLEVTHVVLDWKMWALLAAGSLIITAVFGGGAAWVAWHRPFKRSR